MLKGDIVAFRRVRAAIGGCVVFAVVYNLPRWFEVMLVECRGFDGTLSLVYAPSHVVQIEAYEVGEVVSG